MCIIEKVNPNSTLIVAKMPHFCGFNRDRKYFAAIEDYQVIGLLCYNENSSWKVIPNLMSIAYVSVAEKYRNKGIARKLLTAFYEEASKMNKNVYVTQYDEDGILYLQKLVKELDDKYPAITTIEHDKMMLGQYTFQE